MKVRNKDNSRIIAIFLILMFFICFTNIYPINFCLADSSNFTLKWKNEGYISNFDTFSHPASAKINDNGIHYIVHGGRNSTTPHLSEITCFNGANGNIIWKYQTYSSVDFHVPFAIDDINNDGDLEVVFSGGTRTYALNIEDGSEFWVVNTPSGWGGIEIVDLDGTGYPYIIAASNTAFEYPAKIRKLYGTNGTVAASSTITYCCYGGPSIADLDRDGNYEIFLSDYGKSHCYDSDLNKLWETASFASDSHAGALIDVTGDGNLEVVLMKQHLTQGGIYIYKADGTLLRYNSNLGLGSHVQPVVWDVDDDGHIELITCTGGSPSKVINLTDLSLKIELEHGSEPPAVADVLDNDNLEIVFGEGFETGTFQIYDTNFNIIATLGGWGNAQWSMYYIVQDVDGDGLNDIVWYGSGDNNFTAYSTNCPISNPAPRTDSRFYSERNLKAAFFIPKIGPKPFLSNPSQENGATGVFPSITELTIDLFEPEDEPLYWWITTSPNVGSAHGLYSYRYNQYQDGEVGGTKFCPVSNLQPNTMYTWTVHAGDGSNWIKQSYTFTTGDTSGDNIPPLISNVMITTSEPLDTDSNFGWQNISCMVTDDTDVEDVTIKMYYPDDTQSTLGMTKLSNCECYYLNTSWAEFGKYNYSILAIDTSNNLRITDSYSFILPPNWDIDTDGQCNILDLIRISNHFYEYGISGWIREDVDNNGIINMLDLIRVTGHIGEDWNV